MSVESSSALSRLSELGQSVWIDYLSRDLLESGELARLVQRGRRRRRHVEPVDLRAGARARRRLRRAAARAASSGARARRICSSSSPAPTSPPPAICCGPSGSGRVGRDGYVSIEVDPNLAYETLAQFEEAQRLHERIARPNLFVKIPATTAGVAAIEDSIAAGRSINVTLIFSIDRYVEVARAYLQGLVRFRAPAATSRRCTRSRASSSRASTRRRIAGSTSSARRRS